MTLLRQNSELAPLGIWNWTLPAHWTRLDDGRLIVTCPAAGPCARVCYAKFNAYRFPAVEASHQRNLKMVLDDLPGWTRAMIAELNSRRFWPTGIPHALDHDPAALEDAGYYDQSADDRLAVTAPSRRIGIVANRIPTANRRFAGRPMSGLTVRRPPAKVET